MNQYADLASHKKREIMALHKSKRDERIRFNIKNIYILNSIEIFLLSNVS